MFAYNIVVVVVIITIVRWLSVFVMTTASEKSFRNYSGNPNGQFLYCASVCLFFTVFPFFFYCWIMSSKYWWTFLSGSLPFHVISNYIAIVYLGLILANKNIWSDLNQIWYTCTGQGWRWSGNLGRGGQQKGDSDDSDFLSAKTDDILPISLRPIFTRFANDTWIHVSLRGIFDNFSFRIHHLPSKTSKLNGIKQVPYSDCLQPRRRIAKR